MNKSEEDWRQKLNDPNAAEQLQLNGVALRDRQDENDRANLHNERHDLGNARFLDVATVRTQVLFVEIAREEVGTGDGHDCRGYECTDSNGSESNADKPAREHIQEKCGDREVGAVALEAISVKGIFVNASSDGHVAQELQSNPE